ncbi:MAG TPA: bifunctional pyr operon transcriptional regulator/uracil phosphoribosyltransferase PyrR [Fibrobacteraceae bacterium]|nr:bifunctional pyr operon transcriptional regulator/uracil phosphoribosyltransferase PyrR [Fibrobacteraceae bacterium]
MQSHSPGKDQSRRIRQLLDPQRIEQILDSIADRIASDCTDPQALLIMGMASRGIPLAEKLASRLEARLGVKLPQGNLDATFYRDDFHYRKRMQNPSMKISSMPRPVEGLDIILVDDVLYTGRTIRAAMEALMDMGRPRSIRLVVLVDRGHRELPIAADYAGLTVKTGQREEVRVQLPPHDPEYAVWLVEVEDA